MDNETLSTGMTTCPMCGEAVALQVSSCLYCGEDLTGRRREARNVDEGSSRTSTDREPAVSVHGTILPRYIAASLDNVAAIVLGIAVAKMIDGDAPIIQVPLLVGTYLAYYLLSEGGLSRTPGKLLTGLVILQFDGQRHQNVESQASSATTAPMASITP